MLKDRRVLVENEIVKMKKECGELYLFMVMNEQTSASQFEYETKKTKLSDLMIELSVINQMIEDGNE